MFKYIFNVDLCTNFEDILIIIFYQNYFSLSNAKIAFYTNFKEWQTLKIFYCEFLSSNKKTISLKKYWHSINKKLWQLCCDHMFTLPLNGLNFIEVWKGHISQAEEKWCIVDFHYSEIRLKIPSFSIPWLFFIKRTVIMTKSHYSE